MTQQEQCLRAVPRAADPAAEFLAAEESLGVLLATIVPRSVELLEEIAFFDVSDGSQISLRRDRVTFTPHIVAVGPRAEEFQTWATQHLNCWTEEEILSEAGGQLDGGDIDAVIDAAVVLFLSAPPVSAIEPRWLELAWSFFEHPDADVRDAAVVGTFFRLWESPKVQKKIEAMARTDPSDAVRARANMMCTGWRP